MGRVRSILLALAISSAAASAADWPEWRGAGRQGVWTESGIVERFPSGGLTVKWRTPVQPGYSGPAVARGRVFLLDHARKSGARVTERALCLDEVTGQVRWTREWDADYRGLDYANGPRATPTVDGDRVYVLGAMGALRCLRTSDGAEIWASDFVRDFGTAVPAWGMSGAPLVAGSRLIAVAGGRGNAKVVAFDKLTGKVAWRALSSDGSEPGYSQPILIRRERPQVVVWHATALESLDPETGSVLWSLPFRVRMDTPIATPAWNASHVMVSAFFDGTRMMELDSAGGARLKWSSRDGNEVKTDKLHSLMSQPHIDGGYIYGICSYGQLRCLRLDTGERVWESPAATVERARNTTAWLIRHRDRYFIFNDRAELILANLSPSGYEELGRLQVIQPTAPPTARRDSTAILWTHPAFANRHIVVRNDREVVRLSLDRRDYR